MDAETEQDPFASITKLCQPTASQEARFPNCPLARESDNFADFNSDQFSSSPDRTPSQPAAILMVSPPGSITSARRLAEDDAVFHTPPEHHLPAYFSSEDQNLDELSSDGVDVGDPSKAAKVLEFGGETVPADETEAIVDAFEGSEGVHEAEVIVLDSTDSGDEMATSSLADDLADVISVGRIDAARETGELSKDGVPEVNGIDGNHRLGEECGSIEDIQVNKRKRCLESSYLCRSFGSGKNKEDIVELKCIAGEGCTEMRHENGVGGSEKVVKDGKAPKDVSLKADGKGIEKIDDFRYVGGDDSRRRWKERIGRADGGDGGRRQLPVSLEGKGKNLGGENAVERVEPKSGLLGFLDVLKVVVGHMDGGSEDVDFLGTAKRRGLTFPRPRWWSTEGDDE